jgi:hypothetical protein
MNNKNLSYLLIGIAAYLYISKKGSAGTDATTTTDDMVDIELPADITPPGWTRNENGFDLPDQNYKGNNSGTTQNDGTRKPDGFNLPPIYEDIEDIFPEGGNGSGFVKPDRV